VFNNALDVELDEDLERYRKRRDDVAVGERA
jgi:hypothetical protein